MIGLRVVASVLLLLADAGCANSGPTALDRSHLVRTFNEDFEGPESFWDAQRNPAGRWKTNYFFGVQDSSPAGAESRTLAPNDELEYYGDPHAGTGSFEWKGGKLAIVGKPNPFAGDPRTGGKPYLSGLITTEKSFTQTYGYFEARIAMPAGKGLWPAFWLLPRPRMEGGNAMNPGEQEIDVVEAIGEPGKIYHNVFTDDDGQKTSNLRGYQTNADLTRPHNYGVLVTHDEIVWYFDDHEVRRRPNTDFHAPTYMLLNLAIGGTWPGTPDSSTPFPAVMTIDWVRAYRLN
jgi:beta-glucanase (GH16 family)